MWNFIRLEIDSSLQTNMTRSDSTVLVTRLDQAMTRFWLEKILDELESSLTPRACDFDPTKLTREHHWKILNQKIAFGLVLPAIKSLSRGQCVAWICYSIQTRR